MQVFKKSLSGYHKSFKNRQEELLMGERPMVREQNLGFKIWSVTSLKLQNLVLVKDKLLKVILHLGVCVENRVDKVWKY